MCVWECVLVSVSVWAAETETRQKVLMKKNAAAGPSLSLSSTHVLITVRLDLCWWRVVTVHWLSSVCVCVRLSLTYLYHVCCILRAPSFRPCLWRTATFFIIFTVVRSKDELKWKNGKGKFFVHRLSASLSFSHTNDTGLRHDCCRVLPSTVLSFVSWCESPAAWRSEQMMRLIKTQSPAIHRQLEYVGVCVCV